MKFKTLAHALESLKRKDPEAYDFLKYRWTNAVGPDFGEDAILAWAKDHKVEAAKLCLSAIKLRVSKGYSH